MSSFKYYTHKHKPGSKVEPGMTQHKNTILLSNTEMLQKYKERNLVQDISLLT